MDRLLVEASDNGFKNSLTLKSLVFNILLRRDSFVFAIVRKVFEIACGSSILGLHVV